MIGANMSLLPRRRHLLILGHLKRLKRFAAPSLKIKWNDHTISRMPLHASVKKDLIYWFDAVQANRQGCVTTPPEASVPQALTRPSRFWKGSRVTTWKELHSEAW